MCFVSLSCLEDDLHITSSLRYDLAANQGLRCCHTTSMSFRRNKIIVEIKHLAKNQSGAAAGRHRQRKVSKQRVNLFTISLYSIRRPAP